MSAQFREGVRVVGIVRGVVIRGLITAVNTIVEILFGIKS
jgi:hypothetical protein